MKPALGWFHRYPARFAPRTVIQMLRTAYKRVGGGPCTVLDPFAGSNSTGAAAERQGRKWLAIEAEKEYIDGSRGRFLPIAAPNANGGRYRLSDSSRARSMSGSIAVRTASASRRSSSLR